MALNITGIAAQFSLSEARSVSWPLFVLIVSIALYGVLIFKFYRFLAKRNVLELNLRQYNRVQHELVRKALATVLHFVEYIIIFPLFIMFWFLILSLFIGLISERAIQEVFLLSMALVAATRLTAYYSEDLSRDLAKMIPFALLGIYLVDVRLISFGDVTRIASQMLGAWRALIYYLVVAMALELAWRILTPLWQIIRAPTPPEEEDL